MTIYTSIITATRQEYKKKHKDSLSVLEYAEKIENLYKKQNYTVIGIMLPFIGNKTKLHMRCKAHGDWYGTNINNLLGENRGCPECGKIKKRYYNLDTIITHRGKFKERAKIIHNDKFSYEKFFYKNNQEKSIIICKSHGEFLQSADKHLSGRGCPKCRTEKLKNGRPGTLETFITNANKKHGGIYDYSEFVYIKAKTKGKIKCKIHGEFLQSADKHLSGHGCRNCASYGYNSKKDGFIYLCKIKNNNNSKEYTGYGISNVPSKRFLCHHNSAKNKNHTITNILIYQTINGDAANKLETMIDNSFPHDREVILNGFLKENSYYDQYDNILRFITNSKLLLNS